MQFYKLTVKEIKRETNSAISIVFNIPDSIKSQYRFIAGQYVTLKLTLDGQELRRAYSICSSPKSGELRISVKAVKNGFFSKFANENLKEGDIIEVSLPEGKFVFEPDFSFHKSYLAFAAGSGITPVISIIKSMLDDEPNSTFVLVYGNKTPQDTIFHDELVELERNHLGRFSVHFIYSQSSANADLFGRIDASIVNYVFNKNQGKEFAKYFLCGPEDMINSVSATLKEKNVSEKNIKFELFSTSSTNESNESAATGHTMVKLIVDSETFEFEMSQKQTILEAAIKQGIDVPYSCQGGICSSCICKLSEGSATMKKNQILTDSEINDGLVLACQSIPTTNNLVVDFDNL